MTAWALLPPQTLGAKSLWLYEDSPHVGAPAAQSTPAAVT